MKQAAWVLVGVSALLAISYAVVSLQSLTAARPAPADWPPAATAVAQFQKRLQADPNSYLDYTLLGQAYARQARETGNVADYTRAEQALRRALEIVPGYPDATIALAGTLIATHDFTGALELAAPLAANPRTAPQVITVIGDAHLSLGDYAEAGAVYEHLNEESAAHVSRRALWADLHGDRQRAITLMKQASELAWQSADYRENLAWYDYQIGELHFKSGQLDDAAAHYQAALDVFDKLALGYVGLGKVRAAQGRHAEARALYEKAIAIIPQPEFLAALGDVYALMGDAAAAHRQYDVVVSIARLDAANQVLYNRQLALFYANHDLNVEQALQLAQAEIEVRKDVYGYDALAWALYKNDRFDEAAAAMTQALKLGTQDAVLFYHAGMIQNALGNSGQAHELLAEALKINPHFDMLQAPLAQAALNQLGAR